MILKLKLYLVILCHYCFFYIHLCKETEIHKWRRNKEELSQLWKDRSQACGLIFGFPVSKEIVYSL